MAFQRQILLATSCALLMAAHGINAAEIKIEHHCEKIKSSITAIAYNNNDKVNAIGLTQVTVDSGDSKELSANSLKDGTKYRVIIKGSCPAFRETNLKFEGSALSGEHKTTCFDGPIVPPGVQGSIKQFTITLDDVEAKDSSPKSIKCEDD